MNRDALVSAIFTKKSFLCVGLDPEMSKIPAHLRHEPDPILAFNKAIIDATRDLCVAYKPNLAFYEALGPQGWITLQKTVDYIGHQHLTIADAKRGDIGNTSRMYAEAFFKQMGFDAITIAPYMGEDSVAPFLGFEDKWAIVLALTSNAGNADFQQCMTDDSGLSLWEQVLQRTQRWGHEGNLMFVVGATHPEAFGRVRALAPRHFLLVPGVGAQGGDLKAVCRYGLNDECGLLINASRSILYAAQGIDFAEKARAEAEKMQKEMAELL
jgi:orotidine-5'-phosphate decarboxylase